jgi:peptidoglycan LD-endopeptidase CwlK
MTLLTSPNRSVNLLYPPFLRQVSAGLDVAHGENLMAYIFEAFRSTERQTFLYAQGRINPNPIVTNARAGFSAHQYGIGVDLVFDGSPADGIQWSWEGDYVDAKRGDYARLAVIKKAQGLEWLGDKNIEAAHFQNFYGFTINEIKQIADTKGLLGLWQEFDKRLT